MSHQKAVGINVEVFSIAQFIGAYVVARVVFTEVQFPVSMRC